MYKEIEQKVNKILSTHNITEAPVPIEDIVGKFNIKISYAPSADYSGMLIKKEGEHALMGINSSEPSTRIRFNIAHELGHYFLNKNSVSIDYRSNYQVLNKPKSEKYADFFAANILMPKKMISADFKNISNSKNFQQDNLDFLAKKYNVSTEAMKYRLVNLKLIGLYI